MLSIVYSSRAAPAFQPTDLRALLTQSRTNNERLGLTGMLLYRSGYFLQVIQGPDVVLRERMALIAADDRHADIRVLIEETVDEPLFPEWTMAYEQLNLEPADQVPGLRTTFADLAAHRTSNATLDAIRALVAWYRQRAA